MSELLTIYLLGKGRKFIWAILIFFVTSGNKVNPLTDGSNPASRRKTQARNLNLLYHNQHSEHFPLTSDQPSDA
jgi:hypothetical protein